MSDHLSSAGNGQSTDTATSLLDAWDEPVTASDASASAEKPAAEAEPVKKPRSRAKAAAATTDEPAAEAAPAPKRTRKKSTDANAEANGSAAVDIESTPKSMADLVAMAQSPAFDDEPEAVAAEESDSKPASAPEPESGTEAASPFERLGLSPALLQSISAVGYEEPTPIQEMTIPVLLAGKDVIAQAQTGSGKTAAFGLPIIEAIDQRNRHVQALVLCPTRELAIQVAEALHKYGRHKEVETLPIYGGQPYERQFRGLQRGPQIVVGTPGRVMDHMRRETLNLDHTRFFVLDEADEMLDMGFVEDIEWILQQVPEERQTALFSATMPPRIAELAQRYMNDPERLTVAGKQMTVPETHQVFYEVPRMRKLDALTRILDAEAPPLAMIFCRTKLGVDDLGEGLLARGYQVETLHGDLSQAQRDRVMRRFRTGQADILIATDVAARGLDIPNVSHVINYDIPESAEAYVHRIGRTGRAGRRGEAVTLVTPRETRWIRQIERIVRAKIEARRLPTAADVAERRLEVLKQQIIEVMNDESAYSYYTAVVDDLAEEHDAAQVAAAVLKLYADETGRGAPAEPAADDIAIITAPVPRPERFERERGGDDRRGERGPIPTEGTVRLFLNIGRNLSVRPQDIVGAIANEAGVPGRAIGAIDIFDSYTFVDVPANMAERIIDAVVRSGIKGRSVNAEIARPGDGGGGGGRDRGPRRDFDRNDRFDRGPRRDGGFGGGNRFDRDRGNDFRSGGPQGGPPSFERGNRRDDFGNQRENFGNQREDIGNRRDDFGNRREDYGNQRFGNRRDDVPRQYEREDRPRFNRGPRRDY